MLDGVSIRGAVSGSEGGTEMRTMRTARAQGGQGPRPKTVADLCQAIADRRIPVAREDDEYILTQRDLRRWLGDRGAFQFRRPRQRPAS